MYEIIWTRILGIVFGRTTVAVTLVIAVYMAGLGFGALFWGKRIDMKKIFLKTYGILEIGIAASALFVLGALALLPPLFRFLCTGISVTPESSFVLVAICAFLLLFIPTFLIGGTLPVMSRIFIKNEEGVGKGMGLLYGINTFGAIIGAAFSGYVSIGSIGQWKSQCIACTINLAIGYVVLWLSKREIESPVAAPAAHPKKTAHSPRIRTVVLAIAALSGFCAIAFEVLITRALSIFVANSTYAFTSILIVYLAGLSIGSFLFQSFVAGKKYTGTGLVFAMAIPGFYLIFISSLMNELPLLLSIFNDNLFLIPVLKVFLPSIFLSAIYLFIPALCMGISFPALCELYSLAISTLGGNVGKIYFVNTLGSIAGPLIAAFIAIPVLGVVKSSCYIAILYLIGAVLILYKEKVIWRKKTVITLYITGCVISLPFIALALSSGALYPPSFVRGEDFVPYYKETVSGTVIVRDNKPSGLRTLYVNNSAVCGVTYDNIKAVKMIAHLPFALNPDVRTALVIGLGLGVTTAEIAKHPVEWIDCVEIVPGVRDASRFFADFNNGVAYNPKVHFIGGDGRNYLLISDKKYDFISCDPTHPTIGCGNLYTREYFQLCKDHLSENGVISQYLPLHRVTPDQFKSMIKTFSSVFPHASVWLGHSHGILVGSMQNKKIDFSGLRAITPYFNDSALADPYMLASTLFFDSSRIVQFSGKAEIHTDDRPFLEFYTPQSIREENRTNNLIEMRRYKIDPLTRFTDIPNREMMARYIKGQQFLLDGFELKFAGCKTKRDEDAVMALFSQARTVNPESREIEFVFQGEIQQQGR
jgi:spermidine synthase